MKLRPRTTWTGEEIEMSRGDDTVKNLEQEYTTLQEDIDRLRDEIGTEVEHGLLRERRVAMILFLS